MLPQRRLFRGRLIEFLTLTRLFDFYGAGLDVYEPFLIKFENLNRLLPYSQRRVLLIGLACRRRLADILDRSIHHLRFLRLLGSIQGIGFKFERARIYVGHFYDLPFGLQAPAVHRLSFFNDLCRRVILLLQMPVLQDQISNHPLCLADFGRVIFEVLW